jgi:AraC-like DNA-binding protein
VDDAANATGYGKSNFCKIFKLAYGESFHKILNRHRIENACYFLGETDFSVAEIAEKVGFIDIKTFYRVFKQVTGRTPCEFRNA